MWLNNRVAEHRGLVFTMEEAVALLLGTNNVEDWAGLIHAQYGAVTVEELGRLEDHQLRALMIRRRERARLTVAVNMARLNLTVFATTEALPHGPDLLLEAPPPPHAFRVYATDGSSKEALGQAGMANVRQGMDREPILLLTSLWTMGRVSTLTAELVGLLTLLRWIGDQHMEWGTEHLVYTDSRSSVGLWEGRAPGGDWLIPIWSLVGEARRKLVAQAQVVIVEWRRRRDPLVRAADHAARKAFSAPADELQALSGDIIAAPVQASRMYRDSNRVGPAPEQ